MKAATDIAPDPRAPSILDRVNDLSGEISRLGAGGEEMRRLPDALVALMRDAGLFGILTPQAFGGMELGLADAIDVIEAVSQADAAAGWCLLKVTTSNQLAAYIDPAIARTIWTGPGIVTAGSLNPKGRAERADGGWLLTGRWDWGTATGFSDWLLGGAMLFESGSDAPIPGPRGPMHRVFLFPAREAQFIDTWQVHGMRGTGSQDFHVDRLFVPDTHVIDMMALTPRQSGAFYRDMPYTQMMMLPHAAVATGIARAAFATFAELASAKTPLMSRGLLREKPAAQDAVGKAAAEIEASSAYVKAAIAAAGSPDPLTGAIGLHLAAVHATHRCVEAVDLLYRAAGGSAVYDSSPLQRHFRDIHVAASHFLVNHERYAGIARVTLGLSPSTLA